MNARCLFEGHRNIVIDRDSFPGPEVMIVASFHAFDPRNEVAREAGYREAGAPYASVPAQGLR